MYLWTSQKEAVAGKLGILIIAGLILVLFPLVVKCPYTKHLVIMACIYTILGLNFAMIYNTGMITLGSAAYYAIGAYTSALVVLKAGFSFWIALPIAVIITGVIALVIGCIIVRTGGVPFVFLTMITGLFIVQVVGQIDALGGWGGILNIPRPNPIPIPYHSPIGFATKTSFYYLILFLTLITVLSFFAVYESRIGRAWKAIKQGPDLAAALGINIYRFRLAAFVIASSAAGMAGSFYAHYYQAISPETFGGWPSIFIQLYPVLGGIDYYILGSVAGAIFMTFLPELLRIAEEFEPIITGALLLCVILFFPDGIVGILKRSLWLKLGSRIIQMGK